MGAAALGTASVSFITAGTVMEDKGPLPYLCPLHPEAVMNLVPPMPGGCTDPPPILTPILKTPTALKPHETPLGGGVLVLLPPHPDPPPLPPTAGSPQEAQCCARCLGSAWNAWTWICLGKRSPPSSASSLAPRLRSSASSLSNGGRSLSRSLVLHRRLLSR